MEATLSPLLFKGWLSFARVGESSAFQGPCLERYLHTERHKEQGLAVSEGNVRSLSGIPRGRQPKRELVVQGRGDDLRGQEGTIWNAEFRVQGLGERGRHMLRLTSGTAAGCSVPRLPQTVRSPHSTGPHSQSAEGWLWGCHTWCAFLPAERCPGRCPPDCT